MHINPQRFFSSYTGQTTLIDVIRRCIIAVGFSKFKKIISNFIDTHLEELKKRDCVAT